MHLPVSNVLDQLNYLEQIYFEDNPWDCTCDLVSLKQWVEKLSKDTVMGTILCNTPQKLSTAEVRNLKHDVLCPGLVTYKSLSGDTIDAIVATPAPGVGTSGFFWSLTEAVPLSVLILCLLILFLTFISALRGSLCLCYTVGGDRPRRNKPRSNLARAVPSTCTTACMARRPPTT